ncbi:hypothetical protein PLICRDRAFT_42147 [Plicaturopsis crispa FD-325 SS-3]|nr:hypothetical protein PLICRDRAFT_42147 [Plicaturopsis crispa FD-325 SS-3]
MAAPAATSAFFYGTLMHPKILRRVIGNDGAHLQICPAVLLEYTRHQIQHADYPGIVPYTKSRALFNRELDAEERSVRGTLVTGLTASDIALLDVFEGNEYTRDKVDVHPLSSPESLSSAEDDASVVPSTPPPLPDPAALAAPVQADAYVWIRVNELQPSLWSYADFIRVNSWKWVGSGSTGNSDYAEVDRRREMAGNITRGEAVVQGAV